MGEVDKQMGQHLQVCGQRARLPVNCTPTLTSTGKLWVITEMKQIKLLVPDMEVPHTVAGLSFEGMDVVLRHPKGAQSRATTLAA